ncbi:type IV pilin protein [Marinicella meishanensis]|uniref:type IV pilin protein n=1 Tax=Marinicella meishanensis TaxID=2873263 RepID=UPI001CBFB7D6|nr:type IV pilin protein [Marinicella sp. NBU2979]
MNKKYGFTLIELLVVIGIIALLASYAIPSYRQYVVESKRAEAHAKLLEVAGLYEKFYANTNTYPTNVTGGGTALTLDNAFLVWNDYQIVQAGNAGGAAWRIQANARGGQAADDAGCASIWVDNLGRRGPNDDCWNN